MTPSKPVVVLVMGILPLLVLGYIDYITGIELNFFVFYFIPISLVAWHAGRTKALTLSLFAAIIWLSVDKFSGHHYTLPHSAYWNAFVRLSSFVILAMTISQLKSMLEKEKRLKEELALALKRIQEMMNYVKKVAEGEIVAEATAVRTGGTGYLDDTFDLMLNKLAEQKNLEKRIHQLERQAIMAETASFLAHEIRNPLNFIMLTAHHLGNQFSPRDEKSKEKFKELIASLKSEVEQLNKVVADFMAMGKPVGLTRSHFSIAQIFKQVETLIRQQLVKNKITLHFNGDADDTLFADQEKIRLVLLNILVNAITAAPQNGTIWFDYEKRASPSVFIIHITDDGPGIRSEDLQRIFEPYFTSKPEGTGLGLSLVKRIVEEHDGTIKAENHPGKGARFTICLPLEET
jgi:signal transduction histidine kinase